MQVRGTVLLARQQATTEDLGASTWEQLRAHGAPVINHPFESTFA